MQWKLASGKYFIRMDELILYWLSKSIYWFDQNGVYIVNNLINICVQVLKLQWIDCQVTQVNGIPCLMNKFFWTSFHTIKLNLLKR